jgi:carbohydrate diacid regulator
VTRLTGKREHLLPVPLRSASSFRCLSDHAGATQLCGHYPADSRKQRHVFKQTQSGYLPNMILHRTLTIVILNDPPLDRKLAAAFIQRLSEHIDYNMIVVDRDGIIIASRDQACLGAYHEVAHRLVQSGLTMASVGPGDLRPVGVKPGVSLPILYRGKILGVVGVTGDPKETGPIAFAAKASIETMIEHELYKEQVVRRQNKKNIWLNYLLQREDAPLAAIEDLASKLGYDSRLYRAPILFRVGEAVDVSQVLTSLKQKGKHSNQDISFNMPDGTLLVFKTLRFGSTHIISSYRSQICCYVAAVQGSSGMRVSLEPSHAYVGIPQNHLSRYEGAYRQVIWLKERSCNKSTKSDTSFFLDSIHEYFMSKVQRSDLLNVFETVTQLMPSSLAQEMNESILALFESAFNLKEAAARLGVHRNTLNARLGRLFDILGVDIRHDSFARDFLLYFARYLVLPGALSER